jgi:hypothetical protein
MLGNWHRALFIIIIVLPFLAQGIPFPGGIPLFLPFAILLLPATLLLRISDKGTAGLIVGDSVFMVISAVTLLTYVYGIVLTIELPGRSALKEVVNGIVTMTIVFAVANSGWTKVDRSKLVTATAWAMLAIGVFVGAIGAWKFWLFVSRREMLDFVVEASSKGYPWGTSLHSDYNFFALTILAAILSAMFLATGRRPVIQAMLALTVAGLIVVGFLAGSRRFWLVAPLFIALQGFWMISRSGIRSSLTLFGTLLFFLVGVPLAILVSAGDDLWQLMITGWNLQSRLATLFDSSIGFGMGARFEMWYFATDRLAGAAPWVGSGFDYMSRFSCEFGDCSGGGYPHMPILSAYLYGGWIAAIAAFALYAYITIAGFRLLAHGPAVAWLVFPMMAAFFFAAISANGPYSIRSHIMLGALCVAFLRAEKLDAAAAACAT